MNFSIGNTFSKKYDKLGYIGKGAYGCIYEVANRITKQKYACKEVILDDDITYCVYNELIAWHVFDHPNIVKIFDVYCEKNKNVYQCYIIMEKCDMSLADLLLDKQKKLTFGEKISFLEQIISALMHMREKGYVHNDLSLTNILVKDNQIKIIDFGFIYNVSLKQPYYHKITQYVQAPELINGTKTICNPDKIDTWALGMIFYAICYNKILLRCLNKQYYLDLITRIGKPSIKLLKRYGIIHEYNELYYKLILETKYPTNLTFSDDEILEQLDRLVTKSRSMDKESELVHKTLENKFIKKLINWNVNRRPNIWEVQKFYDKIFEKHTNKPNIMVQNVQNVHIGYSSLYNLPLKEHIDKYTVEQLWQIMLEFKKKFVHDRLFTIHLGETVLKNTKTDFDLRTKTMHLMSQIWEKCNKKSKKLKNLDKIISNEKNNGKLESKLEINFDRFYSFANIINYHCNDFDKYLVSKKSIYIKKISKLQYYFVKLLDFKIKNNDAWALFVQKNIDKKYEPYFKFLYYLFLSSPLVSIIDNEYILSALLLIIGGFFDISIQTKISNHLLKIDEIINFINGKYKTVPNILCQNYRVTNKTFKILKILKTMETFKTLKTSETLKISHKLNLSIININSYLTSFYFFWLVKKIPMDSISLCKNEFGIGKKFIKYIQNYCDAIKFQK